jgi:hypothetical protein
MFFNDDKSTVGSITREVHKNLLTVHAWRNIIFCGALGGVQKEA